MGQPPTPKNLVAAAINAAKVGEGIDLSKHGSPEHTLKEAELATEELRKKIRNNNRDEQGSNEMQGKVNDQ